MNTKEVAELRRRWQPEKNAVRRIYGCFVNERGELITDLDEPLSMLPQEEAEQYFALLKKSLSGRLGKHLIDLVFSTQQVVDSEEHRLLMALRGSSLADEEAVQALFQRVISSLTLEGNYLILLAHDTYDVPYRAKDGERMDDASDQVFSYILCSICPVKLTKPALSYFVYENAFHDLKADWVVSPPEAGFLFPAFDERTTNLYNALYYSRDIGENHPELIDALFRTPPPMPAAVQKETFESLLEETLAEDCSYHVVQAVHSQLRDMIEEHKASKEEQPLLLSKGEVRSVLSSCGVAAPHVDAFEAQYDQAFGPEAGLSPRNLVDPKQLEVRTPDVTIHVNPERSDLVETRMIEGTRYILIRANEGVEVNGVSIQIS